MLRQRRGVIRNDDPWKLDRVAQRSVARLWQRQALNNAAQNRHRGDGDQSEEPNLVTHRGRFDAEDSQSRPNTSEQNGGLPTPHEQPHRGFGRSRDKWVGQPVHFCPPFLGLAAAVLLACARAAICSRTSLKSSSVRSPVSTRCKTIAAAEPPKTCSIKWLSTRRWAFSGLALAR